MADFVDALQRSNWMAAIKGCNTQPEMFVRRFLHRHGFRYRLHDRRLPGSPDVVLPKFSVCIFVHGCFWHRHAHCKYARLPSTRPEFWKAKFLRTVQRDQSAVEALLASGWRVFEIWECGIKDVRDPDLSWLAPALTCSSANHMVWPSARQPLDNKQRRSLQRINPSEKCRSRRSNGSPTT